jgi:hypothetical protein
MMPWSPLTIQLVKPAKRSSFEELALKSTDFSLVGWGGVGSEKIDAVENLGVAGLGVSRVVGAAGAGAAGVSVCLSGANAFAAAAGAAGEGAALGGKLGVGGVTLIVGDSCVANEAGGTAAESVG